MVVKAKKETSMARELTDKQKRVLSTLEAYWTTHHVPPSISDLAKQLGINKATAYEHLLALKKKGYLIHQARAGRTWRLAQHNKNSLCSHQQVPLLGRVTSGVPLLAAINIDDHITCDFPNNVNLFAMRVVGDSMINAHIKNNDLVIAEQHAPINNRDIVVALIDDKEIVIKRFEKVLEKIILNPENDSFSPLELDAHRVKIVGKVIEVRRTLI
jgi:repressor LexA